jgi:DNA primase
MAGRVVIPIHDGKGNLLAYAGRALGKEEPKYLLPGGFHKHLVLYNLHRIGDLVETVVLVEGFFPTIWLVQCGFPNTLGLMGHSISDAQLELLNFKNVILMLDSSEKGEDVREKTLVRIAARSFVRSITLPPGKQPDDLTKAEVHSILNPLL